MCTPGWRYSSAVECLPGMCKALGLASGTKLVIKVINKQMQIGPSVPLNTVLAAPPSNFIFVLTPWPLLTLSFIPSLPRFALPPPPQQCYTTTCPCPRCHPDTFDHASSSSPSLSPLSVGEILPTLQGATGDLSFRESFIRFSVCLNSPTITSQHCSTLHGIPQSTLTQLLDRGSGRRLSVGVGIG